MSLIRLDFDEDSMRRSLVKALRDQGVDVVPGLDVGMIERPDEEHLKWATAQERVLFSFNVGDFYALHTAFLEQGTGHRGIILAQQQRYSVGEEVRRLMKLTAMLSAEEMTNRVEFLGAWG